MEILVVQKEKIASFIADIVKRQLALKPTSVLGMTTGSTPLELGIYKEWIKKSKEGEMNFSVAKFVNPDEILGLPENHLETYRMYMKKHLFTELSVPERNTLIPSSSPVKPVEECATFEKAIQRWGGIDLQLMGLGKNGHIAFMEPAESIPYSSYIVKLEEENRPSISGLGRPSQAITAGLGTILNARSIVLVATGTGKAAIVEQAFTGPLTTKVPASLLQLHKNTTIILDEGSASELPKHCYKKLE